jgi:uncharacterized cupin superfamily protein
MNMIELIAQGKGELKSPPAEIVLDGTGASELWELARFQGGDVRVGVWRGEPGSLTVRPRAHHEVFCVISGKIRLLAENGDSLTVAPGQSAYVPKGWQGVWQTVVDSTKHYVILTPPATG